MAVTVTRTTTLFTDSDSDGKADANDVLLTHVLIKTTGATLTNLQMTTTENGVTIIPGSVMVTPIAFDDFSAASPLVIGGNTPYIIMGSSLLANDVDPDNDGTPVVTISSFTNLNHVTITDIGGGSFRIVPETGYQGVASFDYFVTDEQGLTSVDPARVHLSIQGLYWYVDSDATTVNGDGSYLNPFKNLDKLNGVTGDGTTDDDVDGDGHTIFIYDRGNSVYTTGITLENNQKLYGDGFEALNVNGFNIGGSGVTTNSTFSMNGAMVKLASGNTVSGIDFVGTGTAGVGIQDNGTSTVGTLSVSNVGYSGAGRALDLDHGGTVTLGFNSIATTGSSGDGPINLVGVQGSLTVSGAVNITGTHGGPGINVTNSTGAMAVNLQGDVTVDILTGATTVAGVVNFANNFSGSSLVMSGGTKTLHAAGNNGGLNFNGNTNGTLSITGGGLDITAVNGTALSVTSGGTATIGGALNFVGTTGSGPLVNLNSVSVGAGGMTFESLEAKSTTAGTAISIDTVGGSGNFTVTGTTDIAGSTLHNVNINNSSVDVTLGTSTAGEGIRGSAAGSNAVRLNQNSGDFDYNGAIAKTTDGNVIVVSNKTGGTVNFDGAVNVSGGTGADGITLTSNTGTTTNFTNTLTLTTTNSTGFNAVSGGTISVTGNGSVISSGSGIGVNITDTTIAAGGVKFQGVTTTGAVNGINLSNTGAGGFTITGLGGISPGAGGTISTSSGAGMNFSNTGPVSLTRVIVQNGADDGIRGNNVNGFTITQSNITGNGNALTERGIELTDLKGSGGMTNVLVSGSAENNVRIENDNATLTSFNVTGSTFKDTNTTTGLGDDGFIVLLNGSGSMTVSVTNSTFTDNKGDHFQAATDGDASGPMNITFTNNQLNTTAARDDGGNDDVLGGGVTINTSGTADIVYNISNNNIQQAFSTAININLAPGSKAGSTLNGTINNNTIGTNGVADSGSESARGISVASKGLGSSTVAVTNNQVFSWNNEYGINIETSDGNSNVNAAVTGNFIRGGGVNSLAGIHVMAGATATNIATGGPDKGLLEITLTGNDATGSVAGVAGAQSDIRLRQRFDTTIKLPGYGGSPGDNAAVASFVAGNNDPATAAAPSVTVIDNYGPGLTGGGYIGGADTMLVNPAAFEIAGEVGPDSNQVDSSGETTAAVTGYEEEPVDGATSDPVAQTPESSGTAPPPVLFDDGVISQAELDMLVAAAIDRWAAAGATAEQIEAMKAVKVTVAQMAGIQIGGAQAGTIQVDDDGAGFGWFVDSTPGEDSEYSGTGTRLTAVNGAGSEGRIDLLTVLMHELGHQIGLEDVYQTDKAGDLMYGYVNLGERRLPASGEAAGADGSPPDHEVFVLSPVVVGTLPDGKSVDIQYKSTVNPYTNSVVTQKDNTSTASWDGGSLQSGTNSLVIGAPLAGQIQLDTLTLGGTLFLDNNKNGILDGGDTTAPAGVTVTIYADDGDGVLDAGDTSLGSVLTIAGGTYTRTALAPGFYIVEVSGSNFQSPGGQLIGKYSSVDTVPGGIDPDNDTDNDDNGVQYSGYVASLAIQLTDGGEPITDGDASNDTNFTVDFGFITPNVAPTIGALNTDTGTYVENASAVALDTGGNATVTDGDSANFAGGTFSIAWNSSTGDTITFGSGTSLDGSNNVSVGATQIGVLTLGSGSFSIALNSNANAANIQTLIRALQFISAGDKPTGGLRTFTWTLKDGDGTDGGLGTDTATATTTINVVPVSDHPEGANRTGTGLYDSTGPAYTFTLADFATGFSDPNDDPANAFAGVRITTLPSASDGTIYFDSNLSDATPPAAIAALATFTKQDLIDGKLTFVGAAGAVGHAMSFTFQVIDDGSTSNGGVVMDPNADTFDAVLLGGNANPLFQLDDTGPSATLAYTEDQPAQVIAPDAQLSDSDSPNFDTGKLTVKFDANGEATDQLGIQNQGTGSGQISVGAGTVSYENVQIGTFTGGTNGTNLVVTLDADATPAAVQALVRAITYHSTSNSPGTGSRTVNFKVEDGDGGSAQANAAVNITVTNDSPGGTDGPIAATEDAFRILRAVDFGFTDPDALDSLTSVTITAVSGGVTLYYDADGTEGGGDPVAVTSFPQTYTSAELADGTVSVKAGPNVNGNAIGTITFQVTDAAGEANSTDPVANVLTVNVAAANDTPVVPDSPAASVTEGSSANSTLMPAITVSDIDLDARNGGDGDYGGATFTIARTGGGNPQDQFILHTSNAVGFTVTGTILGGGDLQVGGLTFGNWSWNSSTGTGTINFTSSQAPATTDLVNAVLQALQYNIVSDTPPASVNLTYSLNDGSPGGGQGGGAQSGTDSGTITVNITATNDGPWLDLLDPGASTDVVLNYTENDPATILAPTATVIDPDLVDFDGGKLTVSLAPTGVTAEDRLTIVHQGMGSGEVGVSGSNVYYGNVLVGTFTGGTDGATPLVVTFNASAYQAAVIAVVRRLAYTNVSDTPTTADRVINIDLTDGDGGQSNLTTATVHVAAVNDAAVAKNDAVSTLENVIGVGSLFLSNGSGSDSDAENDSFSVTQITVGSTAYNPGDIITMPSGAKLTVNADGTYSYDPNGKFNSLTDNTSGAVNTSAVGDTFTYTITGGSTATVTVTVNGVAGAGDILKGDANGNTITGTPQGDLFYLQQGGDDTVYGLGSNDSFLFGGAFTSADVVDGGGGTVDELALQGDYSAGVTLTNVTNVELLVLLPGDDTRFGDPGTNFYDYKLTTVNGNVAPGATLNVDANRLRPGEDFIFDGSAETDGSFFVFAGKGVDVLTGGAKGDTFLFRGPGNFTGADTVNGGGGLDELALRGDYTGANKVVMGATTLSSIEAIVIVSGHDIRYGRDAGDLSFDVKMHNANVASGETLIVDAGSLRPAESLTFDGSLETDGMFRIFGGQGADVLKGGSGADTIRGGLGGDTLYGGGGNDTFVYRTVEESFTDRDSIQDFSAGDLIDLSRIDANVNLAGDQAFTFIGNAGFHNVAGELRFQNHAGNIWLVQADTDGNGQADFEIFLMITDNDPITSGDFLP